MAERKKRAYKAKPDKRILVIYDYVEQTSRDKADIASYLNAGYVIEHISKPSITVEKMREQLKGTDFEAEFEKYYSQKNGFHQACAVYQDWKRQNNKAKKDNKGK